MSFLMVQGFGTPNVLHGLTPHANLGFEVLTDNNHAKHTGTFS
jgi:hypothetical protein